MAIDKNISRADRKNIFRKLAKKDLSLKGKHNRKSIEKLLEKSKIQYAQLMSGVEKASAEVQVLEADIKNKQNDAAALQNDAKDVRQTILQCHDVLRNMDFANASDVRIGKEDTAYAVDGKWVHYDHESGQKTPFSKWKKENSPDKSDSADMSEEAVDNPDDVDVEV